MPFARLRAAALLLASAAGLSACSYYDDGYGYGGVSVGVGYGDGYCDPYWDDCYRGRAYDPWYGWYGDYYYPGIGFYVYDRWGRRYRWADDHRRYWEGRRHHWRDRDWNDRRWERWEGFRGDRWRDGRRWRDDRRWRDGRRDGYRRHGAADDRSSRRDWHENRDDWRRGSPVGERLRPQGSRSVESRSESGSERSLGRRPATPAEDDE
jgi:hypothetical protein